MKIVAADTDFAHFPAVAQLHVDEMSAGLLPLLGVEFLAQMYRYAAADRLTSLIVALDGGRVAGFIMGSAAPSGFYRGLLLRTWPTLLRAVARRPTTILRALSVGWHVAERADTAELLSIATHPDYRGSGLAAQLLAEFERVLGGYGVKRFCVTAADTQQAALRFYSKTGGVVVGESSLGGLHTFTFIYDKAPPCAAFDGNRKPGSGTV